MIPSNFCTDSLGTVIRRPSTWLPLMKLEAVGGARQIWGDECSFGYDRVFTADYFRIDEPGWTGGHLSL